MDCVGNYYGNSVFLVAPSVGILYQALLSMCGDRLSSLATGM